MPRPGSKPREPSTSVCEVNAEEHLEFLLKSKQFRPYREDQKAPEEVKIDLSGYTIVKHLDGRNEGYRIEDHSKKHRRYVGSDGVWRDSLTGLTPFDTEFNAWQWLQEEIELHKKVKGENV
jgi:hypothetical protein